MSRASVSGTQRIPKWLTLYVTLQRCQCIVNVYVWWSQQFFWWWCFVFFLDRRGGIGWLHGCTEHPTKHQKVLQTTQKRWCVVVVSCCGLPSGMAQAFYHRPLAGTPYSSYLLIARNIYAYVGPRSMLALACSNSAAGTAMTTHCYYSAGASVWNFNHAVTARWRMLRWRAVQLSWVLK